MKKAKPAVRKTAAAPLDRRTARTRSSLREALMRLLKRKDYGAISIQDLVDEANVGRSTFYAHCSGKDQLLRLSLSMMREELTTAITAAGEVAMPFGFSLPLLEHVAEHRDLYRSLSRGRGHDVLLHELQQIVRQWSKADLARLPHDHGITREVATDFVVSAFMGLLSSWLAHQGRTSPRDLDQMFRRLVLHGLGKGHALPD